MLFGPGLFPDLVMPRNHAAPLIDSFTWQEVPFWMVGPFRATDPIFPGVLGDLELFIAEEVAKLKEFGVLNPPNTPGRLPLFPPLLSSSRGKVVSATLGAPPPDLDTKVIGHSLATDQDEESILSDSYSDRHSSTVDCSAMWGKPTTHSTDKEQKPQASKCRDKDGHKSGDKDRDREREKSKMSDSRHASDRPRRRSPRRRLGGSCMWWQWQT